MIYYYRSVFVRRQSSISERIAKFAAQCTENVSITGNNCNTRDRCPCASTKNYITSGSTASWGDGGVGVFWGRNKGSLKSASFVITFFPISPEWARRPIRSTGWREVMCEGVSHYVAVRAKLLLCPRTRSKGQQNDFLRFCQVDEKYKKLTLHQSKM